MNIIVFDTETTSLIKPFCYDIGYIIINSDNWQTLKEGSFIVEQTWHNLPLFCSAYYADKRPNYIKEMKAKKIKMNKFGYICQQIKRDINNFNVEIGFAYNSKFDEKVFNFNCDWYKCINPFDNIPIKDIRGFVHHNLMNENFYNFCEENNLFTESKNYSTTAEDIYKYITNNIEFVESHTALDDSKIESEILKFCIEKGADLNKDYNAFRSIERKIVKNLVIETEEKTYIYKYRKIWINKEKTKIKLR